MPCLETYIAFRSNYKAYNFYLYLLFYKDFYISKLY